MQKRVTLKDVARATGLHFTTISLALRGSPNIRIETRLKIERAAKKLGYRPDPMLTALSAYRTTLRPPAYQAALGWINNDPVRHDPDRVVLNEYHEGAMLRAQHLGYKLEEFWTKDPTLRGERLERVLRSRNIAGLLLTPQPRSQTTFVFPWEHFSSIAFGYSLIEPQLHVVTGHQFRTMRRVLHDLLALGYRRIGLWLYADYDRRVDENWSAGFWVYYHQCREENRVDPYFYEKSENAGLPQFSQWLASQKPEVIITGDRRVNSWLETLSLRVPSEIGVCVLSVDKNESHQSGCYENNLKIGSVAVDLLVSMLHRGERGVPTLPQWVLVESVWCPGKTLRRIR